MPGLAPPFGQLLVALTESALDLDGAGNGVHHRIEHREHRIARVSCPLTRVEQVFDRRARTGVVLTGQLRP